jgi:hypothetical protein
LAGETVDDAWYLECALADLNSLRRSRRERILGALGLPSRKQVRLAHQEQMYFQAFLDLKCSLGISIPFFPFGWAANSSLLYVLARSLHSLHISSVCELGAGQTTLLFDAVAATRTLTVDSFEQGEFWVEHLSARLQNPDRVRVHHSELREQTVRGQITRFYDLSSRLTKKSFNLVLVDGPFGEKRRSRWGSLIILEHHLADDFLVIFDDADRIGEADTCVEAIKLLQAKSVTFHTGIIEGAKSQFLIASESMRSACFF